MYRTTISISIVRIWYFQFDYPIFEILFVWLRVFYFFFCQEILFLSFALLFAKKNIHLNYIHQFYQLWASSFHFFFFSPSFFLYICTHTTSEIHKNYNILIENWILFIAWLISKMINQKKDLLKYIFFSLLLLLHDYMPMNNPKCATIGHTITQ